MKNILINNTGTEEKYSSLNERFELFFNRNEKPAEGLMLYVPDAPFRNDTCFRYNCRCANLTVYAGFHSTRENAIRISWSGGDSGSDIQKIAGSVEKEYRNLKCIPDNTVIKPEKETTEKNGSKPYVSVEYLLKDQEWSWLQNDFVMSSFVRALMNGIIRNMAAVPTDAFTFETDLQASDFSKEDFESNIELMAPHVQRLQQDTGLLTSVTLAQFILESGYGRSPLFRNSNNCFGMKEKLSGNIWYGSTWNGKDTSDIFTDEYFSDRGMISIKRRFRKYENVLQCIADHSGYMLNSTSQGRMRFEGINDPANDHVQRCRILVNGDYCTNPKYDEHLINIIEKYDLTKYDSDRG